MRIVQIVKTPQRRGAEVFALDLSEELERRGHETAIFYLYRHDGPAPLLLRAQDQMLGAGDSLLERVPGFQPSLLRPLLRALDRFSPDIVQVNGSRSVKYGSLASRLRPGRWPLIARVIGSPADWAGGALKRRLYGRLVLSEVDGVIAVSENTLQGLRNCYGYQGPSAVIPRGVPNRPPGLRADRDVVRRKCGAPQDAPVLLFVGSLTPEKRPDRLVRVFSRVRDALPKSRLWVAGAGPLETEVRRVAKAAGLGPSVELLGAVEDVTGILHAADLLVLTSDTEGTPGVVLEASQAGLPTVATRVGGVPECVIHGETGALAETTDEAGLAEAAVELLQDLERRRRFGERARQLVEGRFGLERVADEIVVFYEDSTKTTGGPRAGGSSQHSRSTRPLSGSASAEADEGEGKLRLMTKIEISQSNDARTADSTVDFSQVAMLCKGTEVYGIGSIIKLYAIGTTGMTFVCMTEGPLTEWLRNRGHRVILYPGITSLGLGPGLGRLRLLIAVWEARRTALSLAPLLRTEDVGLVHAHWYPHWLVAGFLRRRGFLSVWQINNYRNPGPFREAREWIHHQIAQWGADLLLPASDFIAREWKPTKVPVVTVRNAAVPRRPVPRTPPPPLRCISAGRMIAAKGHHVAVEAILTCRSRGLDVHLDIFGGPIEGNEYASELRKMAATSDHPSAIRLQGFDPDLRSKHPEYHLALQCRIDPEPCSLWVCEALVDGLAVIASATGGTPELVDHGDSGYLYEAGNSRQLAEVLTRLAQDTSRLERLQRNAARKGRHHHTLEIFIRQTAAAYASITRIRGLESDDPTS